MEYNLDTEEREKRNERLRNVIIGNMFCVNTTPVDDFAEMLLKDICYVLDTDPVPFYGDAEEHD